MSLGKLIDRFKYGPIVEEGQFEDHRDDYRNLIQDMDQIDVEVEEWYDALPFHRGLFPTAQKTSETSEEAITGEEAWDFAESALEEMNPEGDSLNEIPFYFEHRSRGTNNTIRLGAIGYSTIGSSREYRVKFDN